MSAIAFGSGFVHFFEFSESFQLQRDALFLPSSSSSYDQLSRSLLRRLKNAALLILLQLSFLCVLSSIHPILVVCWVAPQIPAGSSTFLGQLPSYAFPGSTATNIPLKKREKKILLPQPHIPWIRRSLTTLCATKNVPRP